jgi:NadR type nicotinamide-nucleotide adenylyltransferase
MEKEGDPFSNMSKEVLKIVIIGPESTGKSTLCEELAQHYDAPWCPEFAREYLLTYGTDYQYEDLLTIAKGQLAMEDEYTIEAEQNWKTQQKPTSPKPLLFIDTDMYVMKVWNEFVFGKCHQWIIDQIVERKYDLYLLCHTDIPWEKDELREYPDLETREKLFHMYKDILINQSVPWANIRGTDEERLLKAIKAVDAVIH